MFSKLVGALIAALGMIVTIDSFVPKIGISPGEPIDPNNMVRGPFIVENNGFFPIHDITADIRPGDWAKGETVVQNSVTGGRGMTTPINRLKRGERATLDTTRLFYALATPGPWKWADVHFAVSYRPSFVWWHKTNKFRYRLQQNSEGRLNWYPEPATIPN